MREFKYVRECKVSVDDSLLLINVSDEPTEYPGEMESDSTTFWLFRLRLRRSTRSNESHSNFSILHTT